MAALRRMHAQFHHFLTTSHRPRIALPAPLRQRYRRRRWNDPRQKAIREGTAMRFEGEVGPIGVAASHVTGMALPADGGPASRRRGVT